MADVRRGTFLLALTDGGGTVPPELGVARRLVERGHLVTVLAEAPMEAQVRATGAGFRPWTSTWGQFQDWNLRTPSALASGLVEHMITGPAAGQAADTALVIDELRPDLVLTGFLDVGAMIAAEARGIPFDILIPNAYGLPAPGMPPFGAGLSPAHGPFGRLRDRVANYGSSRVFDHYALTGVNHVRVASGLAPIARTWDQLGRARRQLILTSAAFDFPAQLPGNAVYVGPVLDDPSWAATEDWAPPPGTEPLVLVAMSSTFQNHAACLQRMADGLGSLPVRGVLTTGPAIEVSAIRAPANVVVVTAAPHAQVMAEADAVVTHGGHGTVLKALAAGVPLVVLPHGRDQADNAVRVTSRGAGIRLSRRASARRIARAVATVLAEPGYREAARELGRVISADAAATVLEDQVESLLADP